MYSILFRADLISSFLYTQIYKNQAVQGESNMYKTITIKAGSGGWGGPLIIVPTEKCTKILSVTGGGVHPVAQKIAEMTGGEAVDGFK